MARPRKHPREEMVSAQTLQFCWLRKCRAAEYLDISLPTLDKYIRDDPDFPKPIQIDVKIFLFDTRELDKWVRNRGERLEDLAQAV